MERGRRARILIEPYKQLRFGITFILLNIIFSCIAVSVFIYFLWDVYSVVVYYFEVSGTQSQITLMKLGVPVGITLVLFGLFILTTLYLSAKYTHQFYGPLVSINRFLDDVISGKKPETIYLRQTDQLQDLAQKLNQLAKNLK